MMSKKEIIDLATVLRNLPATAQLTKLRVITELSEFCERNNPRFNKLRFFDYIAGRCGSNGGKR